VRGGWADSAAISKASDRRSREKKGIHRETNGKSVVSSLGGTRAVRGRCAWGTRAQAVDHFCPVKLFGHGRNIDTTRTHGFGAGQQAVQDCGWLTGMSWVCLSLPRFGPKYQPPGRFRLPSLLFFHTGDRQCIFLSLSCRIVGPGFLPRDMFQRTSTAPPVLLECDVIGCSEPIEGGLRIGVFFLVCAILACVLASVVVCRQVCNLCNKMQRSVNAMGGVCLSGGLYIE
jgi:hypothetical protein